ncbi:MAG: SRPBCC family protein [Prevotella sp.]|jgi:carbon monoxide dehydrogenase subunit G|nr:SRPBCC family protein [Prevotella sp.]
MSKFESNVKQVAHPQQAVYDMLSNLNNIERVKDRLPEDKFQNLVFSSDSVSIDMAPVGTITLNIVEREEPKCVKFQAQQSPVPFTLWVQMLPVTDLTSKLKCTIDAELNPFIKAMVSKPLQEALEKMADALALIPYDATETP